MKVKFFPSKKINCFKFFIDDGEGEFQEQRKRQRKRNKDRANAVLKGIFRLIKFPSGKKNNVDLILF